MLKTYYEIVIIVQNIYNSLVQFIKEDVTKHPFTDNNVFTNDSVLNCYLDLI